MRSRSGPSCWHSAGVPSSPPPGGPPGTSSPARVFIHPCFRPGYEAVTPSGPSWSSWWPSLPGPIWAPLAVSGAPPRAFALWGPPRKPPPQAALGGRPAPWAHLPQLEQRGRSGSAPRPWAGSDATSA